MMTKHSVSILHSLQASNDIVNSLQGHQFSRTFRHLGPWDDILVTCSLDIPPTRRDESVMRLCSVTSDLTQLKRKAFQRNWSRMRPYYTAHYAIVLGVQNTKLNFSVEFKGQRYGVATVTFDS